MSLRWLTVFLDLSPGSSEVESFWAAVTGSTLSSRRGEHDEFATLLPADGDAYLRVQRLGEGADRLHLDLHVDDVRATADRAVALGAVEVADLEHVVLRSPHGLAFCCVPAGPPAVSPAAATWPDGHASAVDQVCLDIPAPAYEEETGFWAALTGWEQRPTDVAEYSSLVRPAGQPVRVLLQRLGADDPGTSARAHLDLATTDRPAEVARLEALGAHRLRDGESWTVLTDPVGRLFCVTDRHPWPDRESSL